MKCPKCGYLGYERVERCRNCGYEFSLGSTAPTPDLRLRDSGTMPRPLDDLDLLDAATPAPPAERFNDAVAEPADNFAELPLFGPPITDDVPLITKASPPRPPLSVRRASPELPRLRSEPRAPLLDWSDSPSSVHTPAAAPRSLDPVQAQARSGVAAEPDGDGTEPASIGRRAVAASVDLFVLSLIDVVVVYLTAQVCGLSLSELTLIPKAPLIFFLLLQNGGYLVAFTSTGQTLGKMIAGVRVLADDSDEAPDVGRAALRAAAWLLLVLPAGLGLLSATLSRDGRGLHDRFAGTRVVRSGA